MESTIRLKTVFVLPLLLLSRLNLDVHVDGQDRIRTVLHAYTYREVRTPAPHLLTCGLSSLVAVRGAFHRRTILVAYKIQLCWLPEIRRDPILWARHERSGVHEVCMKCVHSTEHCPTRPTRSSGHSRMSHRPDRRPWLLTESKIGWWGLCVNPE